MKSITALRKFNSGEASVLEYCKADSEGKIKNQDAQIKLWLSENKKLFIPSGITVYPNSPLDLPRFTMIEGGGIIQPSDTFNGSYLLSLDRDVSIDNINIANLTKKGITLVKMNGSHDCEINNSSIYSVKSATLLDMQGSHYVKINNNTFAFLDNTVAETNNNVGIKIKGSTFVNIIGNNIRCTLERGTNKFEAIIVEGDVNVDSIMISNNTIYAFNLSQGGTGITLIGNPSRIVISNNIVKTFNISQDFNFILLKGNGGSNILELYGLSINGNIVNTQRGWFMYGAKFVNLLQCIMTGNTSINSTLGVDVYGFHSLFTGNTIKGRWFGQDGNQIVATNNLNASIEGSWNSNSKDNVTTV